MALKDKNPAANLKPDADLAAMIRPILSADGTVSCASAMRLAENKNVPPGDIGRTLDALGIHLAQCQIGTFGYPGHAKGWDAAGSASLPVPEGLGKAVQDAGRVERRITCPEIWQLAAKFRISRMQAGYLADRAGLKIKGCPLGAF